jgi:hypothetical protein
MDNIDRQQRHVNASVQAFLGLAKFFLGKEKEELPDFVPETETLLLDLEADFGFSLNRRWFRRASILPSGNYRRVFR